MFFRIFVFKYNKTDFSSIGPNSIKHRNIEKVLIPRILTFNSVIFVLVRFKKREKFSNLMRTRSNRIETKRIENVAKIGRTNFEFFFKFYMIRFGRNELELRASFALKPIESMVRVNS